MRKTAAILGLMTACVVMSSRPAWAAPTVAEMLGIKPKLDDVAISTPAGDELKDCKVDDVTEGDKKIGYVMTDGRKQILRRYVAGKNAPKINVWSFYKDGVEVFRQIDSNFDGKVDQYRWLGTAGLKWGVDRDQDGKIDVWYMISAEEVAHELFLALATGDADRLKALTISAAEIGELSLPTAAAAKMQQAVQAVPAKFQKTLAKQPSLKNATFMRVESAAPGCWVADGLGTPKDLIKYASRSVLYETADKKHDWFLTGEMIQVGLAWRLVDVTSENPIDAPPPETNPQVNKLLAELDVVEKKINEIPNTGKPHAVLAGLYEQRAGIAEAIAKVVATPAERETWYKQILDGLSSAVVAGNEQAKTRLAQYRELLVRSAPGGNLAAYAVFREAWAKHGPAIMAGLDLKAQERYHEELVKFVKDYPKADDTPDALHQLGMNCEFAGTKEKEDEAARWYRAIHERFPEHHLAEWAKGAERRLKLAGNPLELSGTLLSNTPFNINQLKGKVTVVHYWASQSATAAADFARLKQGLSAQKDVQLVCVNLDGKTEAAAAFLQQFPIQAHHVAQAATDPNGLRGALATYYGVNVLPTVFLVGTDGRVINPRLQLGDLEEALKKAVAP